MLARYVLKFGQKGFTVIRDILSLLVLENVLYFENFVVNGLLNCGLVE